jgi:hypothetical protein
MKKTYCSVRIEYLNVLQVTLVFKSLLANSTYVLCSSDCWHLIDQSRVWSVFPHVTSTFCSSLVCDFPTKEKAFRYIYLQFKKNIITTIIFIIKWVYTQVAVCYNAIQDSTIQYITIEYNIIQSNNTPHKITYSTLYMQNYKKKKNQEHTAYTIKARKWVEPKVDE